LAAGQPQSLSWDVDIFLMPSISSAISKGCLDFAGAGDGCPSPEPEVVSGANLPK
jgi:hypothetical protein